MSPLNATELYWCLKAKTSYKTNGCGKLCIYAAYACGTKTYNIPS